MEKTTSFQEFKINLLLPANLKAASENRKPNFVIKAVKCLSALIFLGMQNQIY